MLVKQFTEESWESKSSSGYTQLVENWGREISGSLAVATYYYLYRNGLEQQLIADIDRQLFEGNLFAQYLGEPAPGRYVGDSNSGDIEIHNQPSSPQPSLNPASESGHDFHYSNAKFEVLGRIEEKKALKRFTDLDSGLNSGFQWMQLAGAGGQGKSRLANELILECQEEWAAGFLWKGDLEDFKSHWRTWQPSKPHLMVIDYVIGLEAAIGDAMGVLARRSEDLAFPVRILLVERQRWDKGSLEWQNADPANQEIQLALSEGKADWFYKLNNSAGGKDLSKANIFEAGVIELTTLEPVHLVKIVRQIVEGENKRLEQTDELISTQLHKIDHSGRPLYAYFFARALIDGRFRPDWDKARLLQHILEQDFDKRWSSETSTAPTLDGAHPAISIALLATLIRSVDKNQLSLLGWTKFDAASWHQAFLISDTPVQGGLMGPGDVISGLEPDILGEWFVLTALQKSAGLLEPLVSAAWTMRPVQMASFLLRVVQDFPTHNSTVKLLDYEPSDETAKAAYATIAVAVLNELSQAGQQFPATSIRAIHKAAETGDVTAMNSLGVYYHYGEGLTKDIEKAIEWYDRAAKAGNGRAMNGLGVCYYNGEGVPQDFEKAFDWYQKGAAAGEGRAMNGLGICYRHGHGVPQDFTKAYDCYSQGAALGTGSAMNGLAICYHDGLGVQQNYEKAVFWYRQAEALGIGRAMNGLGLCYFGGLGVPQDYVAGVGWYEKGAAIGDGRCMNGLGDYYLRGYNRSPDYPAAFKWFEKGAQAGDELAMYGLGMCYFFSYGTDQNYPAALEWYERAAIRGSRKAMNALGSMFAKAQGTAQNYDKAFKWFSLGAKSNDVEATRNLAILLANGFGTEIDLPRAQQLYEKAASSGDALAMGALGSFHYNGRAGTIDYSRAFDWFSKASAAGDPHGKNGLGCCYSNGNGTIQDLALAFQLFEESAATGHVDGMNSLGRCYLLAEGTVYNPEMAAHWFSKAARAGNVNSIRQLGPLLYNGRGVKKDFDAAVYWYKKAIETGDSTVLYNLAICTETGRGTDISFAGAIKLYERSIAAGCMAVESKNAINRLKYHPSSWVFRLIFAISHFGKRQTRPNIPALD